MESSIEVNNLESILHNNSGVIDELIGKLGGYEQLGRKQPSFRTS